MKVSFCSPSGLRQELCSADAFEALVTVPVVVYIGGNRTIFPVEFFSGTDDLTRAAKALIEHGRIERDEHWVILHQQEWPGMDE
ncbi:hypothetical protein [Burkholderia ubonensis]|uniref:Uncharacterized protein n=1 Tax=Burkholderia ubonensis TaxID=101571 RepID=A0A1R1J2A1_9BURK|nr:hypothetical protein [Burkholderia ubonensis]OMG69376.1 hypothetical protein BW685_30805 [Burkholderia ubonensis]